MFTFTHPEIDESRCNTHRHRSVNRNLYEMPGQNSNPGPPYSSRAPLSYVAPHRQIINDDTFAYHSIGTQTNIF